MIQTSSRRGQSRACSEHITVSRLQRIHQLLAQGLTSAEVAYATGLSESTVSKIRQGRRLKPVPDPWCPRCRCRVYQPCQACRLHVQRLTGQDLRERWRADLKAGLTWPELCRRDVLSLDLVTA